MIFRSVRVRLTLWYAAVLTLVLLIFSLGVYSFLARSLRERLDAGLRSALEVTALSLNHEIEEHEGKLQGEPSFRQVLQTMHNTSFPRQGIAVFEGSRLVADKPGERGHVPAYPERQDWSVAPKFFDAGLDRVAMGRVHVGSVGSNYDVVASEPLAPLQDELQTVRQILLGTVPIAVAFVALGGYFLARRSLKPVVAISETVDRISSRNLDQRLPVANPDDELGKLTLTFNRLLQRLDTSFRHQRQFMADASHELRTPISVARTAAEVTLEGKQRNESDYRESLEMIQQQMLRLSRIVQDMFLLAQADAGVYQIRRTPLYLDEILRDCAKAADVLGKRRNVTVSLEPMDEAASSGDEGLIRQLVMILLDNAVKYTNAGGIVTLELRREDGEYAIRVLDTGSGIPPEAQPHVFRRFYRVDKARSRGSAAGGSGAGLGLAIAQWIVEAHNGRLELTRSTAQGSVFTAFLPLA